MPLPRATALLIIGLAFAAVAFGVNALFGDEHPRLARGCALGIVFGIAIAVLGVIQHVRQR